MPFVAINGTRIVEQKRIVLVVTIKEVRFTHLNGRLFYRGPVMLGMEQYE